MAIDRVGGPGGLNRPDKPASTGNSARKSEESAGESGDRIDLSTDARQIASLAGRAKALPETRADKIKEIRQSLARGTYDVDPRQLARAILEFEDDFNH